MQTKSFSDLITFTRATTGTWLNPATGLLETAAINVPRLEAKGLLFEQQRTNLALQSETFDNAYWGKTRATITANAAVAPSGASTADKLVEDTSNNTHILILNSFVGAASTTYTWSVFVKAAGRNFCIVQVGGAANLVAGNSVSVNLTTGAFTATDAARTAVEAYPNGWWKISTTVTTVAAGGAISPNVVPAVTQGVSSYLGDGSSGLYVWGAQLEIGDGPSSYLPTTSAQVTRAADLAYVLSGDWLGAGQGTIYVESSHHSFSDVFAASLGTASGLGNVSLYVRSSDRRLTGRVYDDTGATSYNQVIPSSTPVAYAVTTKQALAYRVADFQFSASGALATAGATGALPTIDRLNLGTRASNVVSSHMTGHLRRIKYFPYRLTAAELQALTT